MHIFLAFSELLMRSEPTCMRTYNREIFINLLAFKIICSKILYFSPSEVNNFWNLFCLCWLSSRIGFFFGLLCLVIHILSFDQFNVLATLIFFLKSFRSDYTFSGKFKSLIGDSLTIFTFSCYFVRICSFFKLIPFLIGGDCLWNCVGRSLDFYSHLYSFLCT